MNLNFVIHKRRSKLQTTLKSRSHVYNERKETMCLESIKRTKLCYWIYGILFIKHVIAFSAFRTNASN